MNSINTNLTALSTANTLKEHYSRLATSVKRLSTGLRVNSSSDDAAGLAIRELMRADIAATAQGIRNANDAISLIQVADGALGVIDEKLVRMKELAEQAATGTYDSTQRLMIDSEFQAMASEIDRIANATDFNGIKLLDGSRHGEHNGTELEAKGKMKIHFGSANDSAEDYYYLEIGDCTTRGLGLRDMATGEIPSGWWDDAVIDRENRTIVFNIPHRLSGELDNSPCAVPGMKGIDSYQLPAGLKNVTIVSSTTATTFAHKPHVCLFTRDGEQLTGPPITDDSWPDPGSSIGRYAWWNRMQSSEIINLGKEANLFDQAAAYNYDRIMKDAGESVSIDGCKIEIVASQNENGASTAQYAGKPVTDEIIHISKISSDLVFLIGGHAGPGSASCNHYKLQIYAEYDDNFLADSGMEGFEDGEVIAIHTQELAQKALERLDSAIVSKDGVRAYLGAMQNRLENTVANLSIQGENLQAAESRISDTDIAIEMTKFVRNQVLSQSAQAILGQANSHPRMLAALLNG